MDCLLDFGFVLEQYEVMQESFLSVEFKWLCLFFFFFRNVFISVLPRFTDMKIQILKGVWKVIYKIAY